MGRTADALPVGPLLMLGGVLAIGVAGQRVYAAETFDAWLMVAAAPVGFAGVALLALGYRANRLPIDTGSALTWALAAAGGLGLTAGVVLYRILGLEPLLETAFLVLSVTAVGAAGAAAAGMREDRRRHDVDQLSQRATRGEASLDAARGFAVARLDPEGYVDTWSEGARDVTGFSHTDMVGVRLDALYPEGAEREVNQHLQRALKNDVVELDGEFQRADGDTFYGRGAITAVSNGETLLGYLLVLADRTDEHARQEQLERRNQQLEAFASVVSHDLRNPLNVAIGSISMARKEVENDKLETAENALERMERLIEEVLTLARQGKDVDEFERVDLGECVRLAWSSVDEMWAEVQFDDLPAVTADGERLRRLFENLFRNAIEHGGEEATIRVGMLSDADGFYVEDDGPGIPEHKQDEIFDAGFTTGEDGTGLGLAIVKSIAEAHGWEIEATEGMEGGARFEIRGVQILAEVEP